MKLKVHAQRKFAQGAYIPPSASSNTAERRVDVTPSKDENKNVYFNRMSAVSLLDIVAFQNMHTHTEPVVLLERLEEIQDPAKDQTVPEVNGNSTGPSIRVTTNGGVNLGSRTKHPKPFRYIRTKRSAGLAQRAARPQSMHLRSRLGSTFKPKSRAVKKSCREKPTAAPRVLRRNRAPSPAASDQDDDKPLTYIAQVLRRTVALRSDKNLRKRKGEELASTSKTPPPSNNASDSEEDDHYRGPPKPKQSNGLKSSPGAGFKVNDGAGTSKQSDAASRKEVENTPPTNNTDSRRNLTTPPSPSIASSPRFKNKQPISRSPSLDQLTIQTSNNELDTDSKDFDDDLDFSRIWPLPTDKYQALRKRLMTELLIQIDIDDYLSINQPLVQESQGQPLPVSDILEESTQAQEEIQQETSPSHESCEQTTVNGKDENVGSQPSPPIQTDNLNPPNTLQDQMVSQSNTPVISAQGQSVQDNRMSASSFCRCKYNNNHVNGKRGKPTVKLKTSSKCQPSKDGKCSKCGKYLRPPNEQDHSGEPGPSNVNPGLQRKASEEPSQNLAPIPNEDDKNDSSKPTSMETIQMSRLPFKKRSRSLPSEDTNEPVLTSGTQSQIMVQNNDTCTSKQQNNDSNGGSDFNTSRSTRNVDLSDDNKCQSTTKRTTSTPKIRQEQLFCHRSDPYEQLAQNKGITSSWIQQTMQADNASSSWLQPTVRINNLDVSTSCQFQPTAKSLGSTVQAWGQTQTVTQNNFTITSGALCKQPPIQNKELDEPNGSKSQPKRPNNNTGVQSTAKINTYGLRSSSLFQQPNKSKKSRGTNTKARSATQSDKINSFNVSCELPKGAISCTLTPTALAEDNNLHQNSLSAKIKSQIEPKVKNKKSARSSVKTVPSTQNQTISGVRELFQANNTSITRLQQSGNLNNLSLRSKSWIIPKREETTIKRNESGPKVGTLINTSNNQLKTSNSLSDQSTFQDKGNVCSGLQTQITIQGNEYYNNDAPKINIDCSSSLEVHTMADSNKVTIGGLAVGGDTQTLTINNNINYSNGYFEQQTVNADECNYEEHSREQLTAQSIHYEPENPFRDKMIGQTDDDILIINVDSVTNPPVFENNYLNINSSCFQNPNSNIDCSSNPQAQAMSQFYEYNLTSDQQLPPIQITDHISTTLDQSTIQNNESVLGGVSNDANTATSFFCEQSTTINNNIDYSSGVWVQPTMQTLLVQPTVQYNNLQVNNTPWAQTTTQSHGYNHIGGLLFQPAVQFNGFVRPISQNNNFFNTNIPNSLVSSPAVVRPMVQIKNIAPKSHFEGQTTIGSVPNLSGNLQSPTLIQNQGIALGTVSGVQPKIQFLNISNGQRLPVVQLNSGVRFAPVQNFIINTRNSPVPPIITNPNPDPEISGGLSIQAENQPSDNKPLNQDLAQPEVPNDSSNDTNRSKMLENIVLVREDLNEKSDYKSDLRDSTDSDGPFSDHGNSERSTTTDSDFESNPSSEDETAFRYSGNRRRIRKRHVFKNNYHVPKTRTRLQTTDVDNKHEKGVDTNVIILSDVTPNPSRDASSPVQHSDKPKARSPIGNNEFEDMDRFDVENTQLSNMEKLKARLSSELIANPTSQRSIQLKRLEARLKPIRGRLPSITNNDAGEEDNGKCGSMSRNKGGGQRTSSRLKQKARSAELQALEDQAKTFKGDSNAKRPRDFHFRVARAEKKAALEAARERAIGLDEALRECILTTQDVAGDEVKSYLEDKKCKEEEAARKAALNNRRTDIGTKLRQSIAARQQQLAEGGSRRKITRRITRTEVGKGRVRAARKTAQSPPPDSESEPEPAPAKARKKKPDNGPSQSRFWQWELRVPEVESPPSKPRNRKLSSSGDAVISTRRHEKESQPPPPPDSDPEPETEPSPSKVRKKKLSSSPGDPEPTRPPAREPEPQPGPSKLRRKRVPTLLESLRQKNKVRMRSPERHLEPVLHRLPIRDHIPPSIPRESPRAQDFDEDTNSTGSSMMSACLRIANCVDFGSTTEDERSGDKMSRYATSRRPIVEGWLKDIHDRSDQEGPHFKVPRIPVARKSIDRRPAKHQGNERDDNASMSPITVNNSDDEVEAKPAKLYTARSKLPDYHGRDNLTEPIIEPKNPCLCKTYTTVRAIVHATDADLTGRCGHCMYCNRVEKIRKLSRLIQSQRKPVPKTNEVYDFDADKEDSHENTRLYNFRQNRKPKMHEPVNKSDESAVPVYLDVLPPENPHIIEITSVPLPNQSQPMLRARLILKTDANLEHEFSFIEHEDLLDQLLEIKIGSSDHPERRVSPFRADEVAGPSSANDRMQGPSNPTDKMARLSTASEGLARPSKEIDRTARPSKESDTMTGPSISNDRLAGPSTPSDRMAKPSTAIDRIPRLSTMTDRMSRPSTASDRMVRPSTGNDRMVKPPTGNDRMAGPSTAFDKIAGPSTAIDRKDGPSTAIDRKDGPSTAIDRKAVPSTASDRMTGSLTAFDRMTGPSIVIDRMTRPSTATDRISGPTTAIDRGAGPSTAADRTNDTIQFDVADNASDVESNYETDDSAEVLARLQTRLVTRRRTEHAGFRAKAPERSGAADRPPAQRKPARTEVKKSEPARKPRGGGRKTEEAVRVDLSINYMNDFSQCFREAPIFTPTEEEFSDPLAYFEQIYPVASQFGLCKVVAPPGFRPKCTITDDVRFNVANQYISRLFCRWGAASKEMCAIKAYLAEQKVFFTRPPLIEGIELNLPKLYRTVQRHGGLKKVIEKKRWGRVAEEMRFPRGPRSAKRIDQLYVKHLLPYDTLSSAERRELMDTVESSWNRNYKKMLSRASNPLHRQKRLMGESESSDEVDTDEDANLAYALAEAEDCVVTGRCMKLSVFKKVAANVLCTLFPNSEQPTPKEVEQEYWTLVSGAAEHVCVNAASIDTGEEGYGFPRAKHDPYSRHPWNLKMFSQNSGNVLRSLGPVLGVTVPTLHLGMVFATSCWHRDPHGLPWVEYMHHGPPKIWYGIPDELSAEFRKAVETLCPTSCQNKSIWLPSDITMIPPHLLRLSHVPLSRVVQNPGEFIVVCPKAYSSSIATGYTESESVYFAPTQWLSDVSDVFQELRDSCEPTMFSLEQLLLAVALDSRTPSHVLAGVSANLRDIVAAELARRDALRHYGVELSTPEQNRASCNQARKRPAGAWNVREQDECEICRTTLYLSKVTGLTSKRSSLCLEHALLLLEKDEKRYARCVSGIVATIFVLRAELEDAVRRVERRLTH